MTFPFFVIQFVADPMRQEGVNVAVIAAIDGKGYARAYDLPVRAGGSDFNAAWAGTAEFRAATRLSWHESLFYSDFLATLVDIAAHDCGSEAALLAEMRYQQGSVCSFQPVIEGRAETAGARSPEQAVERVFRSYVAKMPARRIDRFPDLLAQLLETSELIYNPDLLSDVHIELEVGAQRVPRTLAFDYATIHDRSLSWRPDGDLGGTSGEDHAHPLAHFSVTATQALPWGRNGGMCAVGGRLSPAKRRTRLEAAITCFEMAIESRLMRPERLVLVTDADVYGEAAQRCERLGTKCIDAAHRDAPRTIQQVFSW